MTMGFSLLLGLFIPKTENLGLKASVCEVYYAIAVGAVVNLVPLFGYSAAISDNGR